MAIPYVAVTHSDGQSWSAAKGNALEVAASDAHRMPTARAVRTAVQAITTATWTLLSWNGTDAWDTDTMHDPSTNAGRMIAKKAGKFAWAVTLCWASNTSGIRAFTVQKNSEALPATANTGVVQGGDALTTPATAITLLQTASGQVDLAVNDYLAVVVFQGSGGNLDIQTDSHFEMTRIAT